MKLQHIKEQQNATNDGAIQAFVKSLETKYKDNELSLTMMLNTYSGVVTIVAIHFPKHQQKNGAGSKVMQEIVDFADRNQITISLTPSTDFGATSVTRLRKFYGRFGFVRNLGRKKDYMISEAMYRVPKQ